MATLRKLRPVFLCALSFVAACLSLTADSAPPPTQSWFDKQLQGKIQLLQAQIHSNDVRSEITGVALLDEISDLRDQVTNASRIEELLREVANDPQAQIAVREEAKELQLAAASPSVSVSSEARAKALLESAASA